MTANTFLKYLANKDIRVSTREGRLILDAPHGALTPELKSQLGMLKVELLALLEGETWTQPEMLTEGPYRGFLLPQSGHQLDLARGREALAQAVSWCERRKEWLRQLAVSPSGKKRPASSGSAGDSSSGPVAFPSSKTPGAPSPRSWEDAQGKLL